MFIFVWIVIVCTFFAVIFSSMKIRNPLAGKRTMGLDGHFIRREQDLTCETEYGHDHGTSAEPRYIVHDDPTDGYVILNGVKRSLDECKYL